MLPICVGTARPIRGNGQRKERNGAINGSRSTEGDGKKPIQNMPRESITALMQVVALRLTERVRPYAVRCERGSLRAHLLVNAAAPLAL